MLILKQFSVAFVSFLVLDFIWLGFVVKKFNVQQLAQIGRIENGEFKILYAPAVLVYVLMALAVVLFVLPRANLASPIWQTFLWGAVMGLIVYGVYDMTNLAILKGYPLAFAFTDMAWGTLVFGLVTVVTAVAVKS